MTEQAAGRARRRENVIGGRPHRHVLRTSDAEEIALRARADAAGMKLLPYLMDRALASEGGVSHAEHRALVTELFALRRLLAANSNNLNQIARGVNAGAGLDASITHTLVAIRSLTERIDRALIDVGSNR